MYANLCYVMSPIKVEWPDTNGSSTVCTTFRRTLLTKCEQEFDKDVRANEKLSDDIRHAGSVRLELAVMLLGIKGCACADSAGSPGCACAVGHGALLTQQDACADSA